MQTISLSDSTPLISETTLSDEHFFDLTLVTKEMKSIKCHQLVISSSSSVLNNILKCNKPLTNDAVIFLPETEYEILSNIVTFMYKQTCKVVESSLLNFFATTQQLGISTLFDKVSDTHKQVKSEPKMRGV